MPTRIPQLPQMGAPRLTAKNRSAAPQDSQNQLSGEAERGSDANEGAVALNVSLQQRSAASQRVQERELNSSSLQQPPEDVAVEEQRAHAAKSAILSMAGNSVKAQSGSLTAGAHQLL